MKRPAFQFYPAEWLGNAKLRSVKPEHRGAWIDLMAFLHQSDEYGVSRWPLVKLARAIACHVGLLHALVQHDILKGVDQGERFAGFNHTDRYGVEHCLIQPARGPIWFSSRMVVDEHLRQIASAKGKQGGNPALRKDTHKGAERTLNPTLKAHPYALSPSPSPPTEEKRVTTVTPSPPPRDERPPPATAAPAASKPAQGLARQRDGIWDEVARLWFAGKVPPGQETRVGKIVRDLKSQGALPAEIEVRLGRYRREWPDVAATPEAMVKHWAMFDGERGNVPSASDRKVEAMRKLMESEK